MHPQLLTVITQATGLPPAQVTISLRPPIDHQSNRLYDLWADGKHFILKEFLKPAEWATAPQREFCALQKLQTLDVAPRPVFYDPNLGPLVVYRFMAGEMWNRRRPTPAELRQLAGLWLQINQLPTGDLWLSHGQERTWAEIDASFRQAFQDYYAWAVAEFPSGQRAAERCLQLLASRQQVGEEVLAMPAVLCFSRADSRFANIICRPDGRLGMVDWEDSGLRDPARDLADLLTHSNQEDLLTLDEWQAFLQPYLAARQAADPDLWRRTHLYLAGFPLFWLSILLPVGMRLAQAGKLAGSQANGLSINQRLQRYLARAAAWPKLEFGAELAEMEQLMFFPTTQSTKVPMLTR